MTFVYPVKQKSNRRHYPNELCRERVSHHETCLFLNFFNPLLFIVVVVAVVIVRFLLTDENL